MTMQWRFFAAFLLTFAASCSSAGPPTTGNGLPRNVDTEAAKRTTSPLASSATNEFQPLPQPQSEPDFTATWMPFPFSRLPATVTFMEQTTRARRELVRAACGGRDIEQKLMESAPIYEAKGIGPILFRADQGQAMLSCKHDIELKLPENTSAWRVDMSLPETSAETVYVFAMDIAIEKFPPTAEFSRDATAITGLPWARCYVGFSRPRDRGCDEISETIGKWPEGNLWIAGRVIGMQKMLEASRSKTHQHVRSADLRTLLEIAKDLEVRRVTLMPPEDGKMLGYVSGQRADGTGVTRYLLKSETAATSFHAKLVRDRDQYASLPPDVMKNCSDCPPGMAKVYVDWINASRKNDRKSLPNQQFRVDGAMVEEWWLKAAEDPEFAKAEAKYETARAKRLEKVKKLLEAWRSGKAPKPEAFQETQGDAFVQALRENMR